MTREHVAFCGSYLIDGDLISNHLYEVEDGCYVWECQMLDPAGNQYVSVAREHHPDIDSALLWVLYAIVNYAMEKGVQPEDLAILQQSYCPESNPEFVAYILGETHAYRNEVRH